MTNIIFQRKITSAVDKQSQKNEPYTKDYKIGNLSHAKEDKPYAIRYPINLSRVTAGHQARPEATRATVPKSSTPVELSGRRKFQSRKTSQRSKRQRFGGI